jgi:hypothetical protein
VLAEVFLAALAGGVALVLAAVAALSYQRAKHPRLAFVGLALAVFAVKDLWIVAGLLQPGFPGVSPFASLGADLVVVLLLYGAFLLPTRG